MSLILDALRRGRGQTTPHASTNAAQTDAVLQTLGYGRFSTISPFRRLKRILGYFAAGLLFAIVTWGTVIWITQAYLAPPRPMEVYTPTPAPSQSATRPK